MPNRLTSMADVALRGRAANRTGGIMSQLKIKSALLLATLALAAAPQPAGATPVGLYYDTVMQTAGKMLDAVEHQYNLAQNVQAAGQFAGAYADFAAARAQYSPNN